MLDVTVRFEEKDAQVRFVPGQVTLDQIVKRYEDTPFGVTPAGPIVTWPGTNRTCASFSSFLLCSLRSLLFNSLPRGLWLRPTAALGPLWFIQSQKGATGGPPAKALAVFLVKVRYNTCASRIREVSELRAAGKRPVAATT